LDYRIPVVFNLSSWGLKQQTIADWLVVELNSKYQVPKAIGQDLLKRQELLLLLDGLDEVKAEHRDSCVAALNEFHQTYAPSIIVCSRLKAYSVLSKRLEFQRAIYLRSLTPEQIRHYLNSVKTDLTGLRALIEGDRALQELAKSPLMLNIMVLTYGGVAVEDLPKTEVVEERRKQLFDAYIERMFYRPTRVKMEPRYSPAQSIGWLTWLAQRMVQNSQTVFSIEEMQPTWLPTTGKRIVYRMVILLINGLIFGLISWLIFGDLFGWDDGLIIGLIIGLVLGIISIWGKAEIKLVDSLNWSWRIAIKLLIFGLTFGLILGLIIGLIIEKISLNIWLTIWGVRGLVGGICLGLSKGLDIEGKRSLIATKALPNQGIYRTAISAVMISVNNGLVLLFFALFCGLVELNELSMLRSGLILELISELEDWLILGLIGGLIGGLISLILGDGKACIQHLTLRLILYRDGYIPWNYARFLDYATDRIFLQKVGGGYIFIHRLLLKHFAQMECDRSR
ncbi:MAG: NACHT domain-containing protein, partial [Coleofasciculus sp. C2-GNP5-27]